MGESSLSAESDQWKSAQELVYASLIDQASTNCRFTDWDSWASYAISVEHIWPADTDLRIHDFRLRVLKAIWPGTRLELEHALVTLAAAMTGAFGVFRKHSLLRGDEYRADRFYKGIDGTRFNPYYERDLRRYEEWEDLCCWWIREATRAANWVAEVVRRDINPAFFATEGKFILEIGSGLGQWRVETPEYSQEEKDSMPDKLFAKLREDTKETIHEEIMKEIFGANDDEL